jgi:hypothetical protein
VMDKKIFTGLLFDEAVALFTIKPFYCTAWHTNLLSFMCILQAKTIFAGPFRGHSTHTGSNFKVVSDLFDRGWVREDGPGPNERRPVALLPGTYLALAGIYGYFFWGIHKRAVKTLCVGEEDRAWGSAVANASSLCSPSLTRTSYSGDRSARKRGRLAGSE